MGIDMLSSTLNGRDSISAPKIDTSRAVLISQKNILPIKAKTTKAKNPSTDFFLL